MSKSPSVTVSPPAQTTRPDKLSKPSLIVSFKVSAEFLRSLLPKAKPQKNSKAKSTPSNVSTPTTAPVADPPSAVTAPASSPNPEASESNSTPAPGATEAPKKKGAAKTGTKRGIAQTDDGGAKSRPKPGPKKKARRDNGPTELGGKTGGGATNGTHKLGPKANQGAINAGLRALDRSGKPCRKWERKPIQLKSFTGVVWELPSWQAPKSRLPNGESQESKEVSQPTGSKPNESSTAMNSEKSHAGENGVEPKIESTPAASSPVPAALPTAIAATG